MNGIFAQRRARLLSMKAVREAGPPASACPGCGAPCGKEDSFCRKCGQPLE